MIAWCERKCNYTGTLNVFDSSSHLLIRLKQINKSVRCIQIGFQLSNSIQLTDLFRSQFILNWIILK